MSEPHDTTRPDEEEARKEHEGEETRAPDTERPPAHLEATAETEPQEAEPQETEPQEAEPPDPTLLGDAADEDDPWATDPERTVNLGGDALEGLPLRDDLENPPPEDEGDRPTHLSQPPPAEVAHEVSRAHLKGLLEALVFVSDKPIKTGDLAKAASSSSKEVKELLAELREEYAPRGIQLDEVAGGWVFRTNAQYAPFVRDLTKQKPVKLSRAQVETLAILAYRQPITRPEIDEIRGVDSGATLKLLLERDLVKILGKKDEPGRPLLYGTTPVFLEFFGLKSLRDLPTLKEFTELNEDSRRVVERELGDVLDARQPEEGEATEGAAAPAAEGEASAGSESAATEAEAQGADAEANGTSVEFDAERAAEAALEAEMELEALEAEGDREAALPIEPRDTLPPDQPIEDGER